MSVTTDEKQIDEILNRGVIKEFLPNKEDFKKKLLSGEKLKFYIGADPTGPALHLSHAKNYILLEEFRKLGHEVLVLIGDFTAMIGDPTDKTATRQKLTQSEVKENVNSWVRQIKPLMDFSDSKNPPRILYNSEWLSSLSMEDILELSSNFTVQQILERDMFEKRMEEEKPIYLHEFLYPLMQGYDSVAMEVDVELCGTDQIFNALAGRVLSKRLKNKDKFVVAVNLMENPKTKELMSKSNGTGIFLDLSASEMYGGVMAQTDEMSEVFLLNISRLSLDEIEELKNKLDPKEFKMKAAFEVVKKIKGESEAVLAEEEFKKVFQAGSTPSDIKKVMATSGKSLMDIAKENELVESNSEFRRLVLEGAVTFNENKILEPDTKVTESGVLKIGKRRFLEIEV